MEWSEANLHYNRAFASLLMRYVDPTFKKYEKMLSPWLEPGYWDLNNNIYTNELNDSLYIDGWDKYIFMKVGNLCFFGFLCVIHTYLFYLMI